jgi:methionyl-tRNA synthetase
MDQALDILPSDYWRWHLIANAPESSDAAFTWESFQAGCNSDLANVFGNFVNRIAKYAASKMDSKVPDGGEAGADEAWMAGELDARIPAAVAALEAMEFRKAAAEVRALWAAGNEYLTKAAPWTKAKTDPVAAAVGVRAGLNLAVLFAILAQPFIPDAAKTVLDALNVPEKNRTWAFKPGQGAGLMDALPRGMPIGVPPVLFAKIEDAQVKEWAERFGGGE